MRILLVSQFFPPETGATSNRMISLVRGLKEAGHEVVIVTAKPNHPDGIIRPAYRGGLYQNGQAEGCPVIHTWVYASPDKGFMARMLNYVSFMTMAVLGARQARGRFDVVLASSPPLFVGVAGWLIARLKGAAFVFDVRDLWPDVAVAMGALDDGLALRMGKALERFLYRRADAITAVTNAFCDKIKAAVPAHIPVKRITNGTEPDVFREDARRESLRAALGVSGQFVVAYAGNMGRAQGLDHIVDAAALLQEETPGVEFHLVGSGPVKETLQAKVRRRGVRNVRFLPRVPLEEAAAHMAAADALLVPLACHPIYRMFIPSKLFDGMAAARPVLLSVEGEARSILREAEAGLWYPAEDGAALAERVRWLRRHPDEQAAMGARGRAYVLEHGTRAVQAQKMAAFVKHVATKTT